jgi:hypothetical protein
MSEPDNYKLMDLVIAIDNLAEEIRKISKNLSELIELEKLERNDEQD